MRLRRVELPEEIEEHRDRHWRREDALRIEDAPAAEALVERLGIVACLSDSRQPGPSLYIAVCGRRDAIMPRNVQKDPESSLTWTIKDELVRRGRVFYGKLARGRALFLAPRLLPAFRLVRGLAKGQERERLSPAALSILRVLRREWEMGSSDLRQEAGIADRLTFNRAMDELQSCLLIIPADVVYQPKFTYIWTLTEARFPAGGSRERDMSEGGRIAALSIIAEAFLAGAGLSRPGELARLSGLSRPDVGLGNQKLVIDGRAVALGKGCYILPGLIGDSRGRQGKVDESEMNERTEDG